MRLIKSLRNNPTAGWRTELAENKYLNSPVQRRVLLARIISAPEILILDEATQGLDQPFC